MLKPLARALAAFTAFLALQGSLLGSGAACALTGHVAASSVGMDAMPEASSAALPGAAGEQSADRRDSTARTSASPAANDAPCEHDTSRQECAALPVCTAFVESVAMHIDEVAAPTARVGPMIARAPAYSAPAPEIPPPRA